jgi:predicted DNA binding CopG/RHH family protein
MDKKKKPKYEIEELEPVELSAYDALQVAAMTVEAEDDLEAARVNFRWTKMQVDLVKTVAQQIGIPYQTYIKQVVFKQAMADLQAFHRITTSPSGMITTSASGMIDITGNVFSKASGVYFNGAPIRVTRVIEEPPAAPGAASVLEPMPLYPLESE